MFEFLIAIPEARLGISLVIGLVVGAEREQRHATAEGDRPGIRTFSIVALLGGGAMLIGEPILLGALGLAVAAASVAGFVVGKRLDAGLTTEMALLLTYALGALAIRMPEIALAAGVTMALLLAFRSQLHGAVRDRLSPAELRDALIVAAAALVVLPMLPDRALDPWHALNPFVLWRLVVAAMAITVAARVLERFVGPRWGPALAGLASGFVSSSATIAAMGMRAKLAARTAAKESSDLDPSAAPQTEAASQKPAPEASSAAAHDTTTLASAVMTAAGSTVATFLQMAVLVTAASPELVTILGPPLGAGALAALAYTAWMVLRAPAPKERSSAPQKSVVSVRAAVVFAVLVGGITVLSAAVVEQVGSGGAIMTAALAAFADAHASAASAASLHAASRLGTGEAALAVLLCLTTNTGTKIVLAFATGPRAFGRDITLGLVIVLAVAWAAAGAMWLLGAG